MNIYGKASFNNKQITDRIARGAAGVEIHLDSTAGKFYSPNWLSGITTDYISAIHMPLSGTNDHSIESYNGIKLLQTICRKAAILSSMHNKEIHVIVHLLETKQSLERMGIYDRIVQQTRRIAEQYPTVIICIENTIYYTSNYAFDNVLLAQDINMPNVGTCLDTCHALITESLTESAGSIGYNTIISLEDIFKANAPLCRHMHLCNASHVDGRYGAYKGHGTPFGKDLDNIDPSLSRIMHFYSTYKYDENNPMIVLEVWENDYTAGKHFSLTKDQVLQVWSQISSEIPGVKFYTD